ncbi:MAG: insulinase family protein [Candidatus Thioglobus sp.]|nr:insulinase family protein [Candidatus Thioglobus sp.]
MKALLLLLIIGNAQAKLLIETWQTPEGASVFFTQTKGLPMLDIALNFAAASATDSEQFGLSALTNSLIGSATKYQNEEQIINGFESLGAQFSTDSAQDISTVSLRTLTRAPILQKALEIFAEVITLPSFQQSHLTREKRQTLQTIKALEQSPASVAELAFQRAVFAGHPYSHSSLGTEQTLTAITLADLQRHYKKYYVAKNLTIALVGDIEKTLAKQIARQISHGLNIGKKTQANADVLPLKKSQNLHIKFPSKQTHLLIGQVGINRSHADYYPLYLGNHIFGGIGLTSILGGEIREKKGLAYSAYSYFAKMQSRGYFLLKLQTKNSQAVEAKNIALGTLNKFISQPISAKLLQSGKDNIIGGFALQTASNSNILGYLSAIGFYNLPLNYLNNFTDKIKNISAEEIRKAFARLVKMDKLIVLTVGGKS